MKPINREVMLQRNNPFFGSFLTDEFFNWPGSSLNNNKGNMPSVNISEDNNGFTLELAVPGFSKDAFNIKVEDDVLTISAEAKTENEEKTQNYKRKEFGFSSFSRSFRLADEQINQENIKASYENGILHIELPKKEEAKPLPARSIAIS